MKLAINSQGFDGWGGGIDFLCHLMASIEEADSGQSIEKTVLLSGGGVRQRAKKIITPYRSLLSTLYVHRQLRWSKWAGFDEQHMREVFQRFQNYKAVSPRSFLGRFDDGQFAEFDVVLPCMSPLSDLGPNPAWVGYIADFQHRRLPHFFSSREISNRDTAFAKMLRSAEHVIVNAESVKEDAQKFVGDFKSKIHVLPYSPCPDAAWLNALPDKARRYGITKPYFMISNQFWIHKDHGTAFEAFQKVVENEGRSYQLVCTGGTSDFRFPQYFEELCRQCKRLGIEKDVEILGHIPKLDQIALLKGAVGVLQPTLFEGGPGGGAGYDSVALGVPLIVSDIPVNREIDENENVIFFEPQNAQQLSERMLGLIYKAPTQPKSADELLREGLKRRKKCGEKLIAVMQEAVGQK